jgi:hypothetical protein
LDMYKRWYDWYLKVCVDTKNTWRTAPFEIYFCINKSVTTSDAFLTQMEIPQWLNLLKV